MRQRRINRKRQRWSNWKAICQTYRWSFWGLRLMEAVLLAIPMESEFKALKMALNEPD